MSTTSVGPSLITYSLLFYPHHHKKDSSWICYHTEHSSSPSLPIFLMTLFSIDSNSNTLNGFKTNTHIQENLPHRCNQLSSLFTIRSASIFTIEHNCRPLRTHQAKPSTWTEYTFPWAVSWCLQPFLLKKHNFFNQSCSVHFKNGYYNNAFIQLGLRGFNFNIKKG